MPRRALITGITGQDGSYLAELLLARGYDVHGVTRSFRSPASTALRTLLADQAHVDRFNLHRDPLESPENVERLIRELEPDEVYHLGSQSQVGASFEAPLFTYEANARSTLLLLEAIRALGPQGKEVRFYQASSSEMFGAPDHYPQTERTRFHPRSPYACSKVCAFHQVVNYREAYGLFACNGILYNHESPRRPEFYVTRKITLAAARIAAGLDDSFSLGNLSTGRDWGYAPEYVEVMWRMLQHSTPDDFIIATNEWHTLQEFLDRAFQRVGLDWRKHHRHDPALVRPAEVTRLQGDYSKAANELGWEPRTRFPQLVDLMVDADVARVASSELGRDAQPGRLPDAAEHHDRYLYDRPA